MVMVSRERLLQLASRGAELANAKRVRLAGHILLFGGVAFLLVRLRSILGDNNVHLTEGRLVVAGGGDPLGVSRSSARARLAGHPEAAGFAGPFAVGRDLPAGAAREVRAGRGVAIRRSGSYGARAWPVRARGRKIAADRTGCDDMRGLPLSHSSRQGGSGPSALLLRPSQPPPGLGAFLGEGGQGSADGPNDSLYAAAWPLIGISFWMTARAFIHVTSGRDRPLHRCFRGGVDRGPLRDLCAWRNRRTGSRAQLRSSALGSDRQRRWSIAAASRAVFTVADLIPAALSVPLLRRQTHLAAEPIPPAQ